MQLLAPGQHAIAAQASVQIQICLLGNFRLLQGDRLIPVRGGGKSEMLLGYLGLHHGRRVPAEQLQEVIWPSSDAAAAQNSLNSLVYSLHRLLGPSLEGAAPVLREAGYYRLNSEAGVVVDTIVFDCLVDTADRLFEIGDMAAAVEAYTRAANVYRGDLCVAMDIQAVIERERLRSRCLSLLARLAIEAYRMENYKECLTYAWRVLANDPCREDAHRLIMRCQVRTGERTAALRHFHTCKAILQAELGVSPESTTVALFEQICSDHQRI
jgi:DNA-binding SARP family transcriptional activator